MTTPAVNPATPAPKPSSEVEKLIEERLKGQDALEFQLGDTLDMKTSIGLVAIVFLAAQVAQLVKIAMPLHWRGVLIASSVCLVAAGAAALFALIPRNYKLPLGAGEFLGWVESVKQFFGEDEKAIVEFMHRKEMEKLPLRIEKNGAINRRKSKAMELSFYATMASFALNIATMLALSVGWRF